MKKEILTVFLIAAVLVQTGCSGSRSEEGGNREGRSSVLVSAAASLTDVMEELAAEYHKEHPDTEILFTFGGSGALQAQIEEGAPVDLFLSAAEQNMDELENQGLIEADSRRDLLKNEIVLIVPEDSGKTAGFADLPSDMNQIALGEPGSVPAGTYARQIFETIGNWEAVKEHAVFAGDVREVLAWVESGEADCGVVYETDAITGEKVRIAGRAPQGGPEVVYPAAVVRNCENPEGARAFLDFLSGEEAGEIFGKWGFTVP